MQVQQKPNRTRYDIYASILQATSEPRTITSIMYKVEIPHSMAKKFLGHLLESHLLNENKDEAIVTTEKGYKFLKIYKELKELLPNQ